MPSFPLLLTGVFHADLGHQRIDDERDHEHEGPALPLHPRPRLGHLGPEDPRHRPGRHRPLRVPGHDGQQNHRNDNT